MIVLTSGSSGSSLGCGTKIISPFFVPATLREGVTTSTISFGSVFTSSEEAEVDMTKYWCLSTGKIGEAGVARGLECENNLECLENSERDGRRRSQLLGGTKSAQ